MMISVLCCVTLGLTMSNGRTIWLAGTVSLNNLRIIQPLSSVDLTAANKLDAPMLKLMPGNGPPGRAGGWAVWPAVCKQINNPG